MANICFMDISFSGRAVPELHNYLKTHVHNNNYLREHNLDGYTMSVIGDNLSVHALSRNGPHIENWRPLAKKYDLKMDYMATASDTELFINTNPNIMPVCIYIDVTYKDINLSLYCADADDIVTNFNELYQTNFRSVDEICETIRDNINTGDYEEDHFYLYVYTDENGKPVIDYKDIMIDSDAEH